MMVHLSALAQTFAIYLLLACAYLGWGQLLVRVLKVPRPTQCLAMTFVWLGWALTLLLFQILHLLFPLTIFVVLPVLLVGIIAGFQPMREIYQQSKLEASPRLLRAVLALVFLAASVWVASRAMLPPENYDSGLYHFNAIRWINSYPIVPGLGNLHGRLAFNQSLFTYAAATNFYPVFQHGNAVANSFLLLLSLATLFAYLRPALCRPALIIEAHPFVYLPALFGLPILAYLALSSDGLASPSPDLTSTLLQLVSFVIFARALAGCFDEKTFQADSAFLLAALAATSITIKLSSLAYAGAILLFVLWHVWRTAPKRMAEIARVFAPAVTIILIWALRGFILSGAPLYPSTFGYVPTFWAVPKAAVIQEAREVYAWGRMPYTHWSNVIGSWDWLSTWLPNTFRERRKFVYVAGFFASALLITLLLRPRKPEPKPRPAQFSLIIPIVLALAFWFFTAPDLRFINATLYLLILTLILLWLSVLQPQISRRIYSILLIFTFLAGNIQYGGAIKHVDELSTSGFQSIPVPELKEELTNSGLAIYVPTVGNQCWDAPLPCTPGFDPALRLIDPQDLGSGFRVTPD